jgi:hypothetical protein
VPTTHNPKSRGTSERRQDSALLRDLVMYLATLFLGASIFLMPIESAKIGMLPLVALLLAILPPCIWLYGRVATLSVSRDPSTAGSGDALGHSLVEAGAGRAGTLLSLIGIGVYVVAAAVTYNRLGVAGLQTLSVEAASHNTIIGALVVALGAALLLVRRVARHSAVAHRLLRVSIIWSAGALLIAVVGGGKTLTTIVALAMFAGGCVVVATTPDSAAESAGTETLTSGHRASVVGIWTQFALMLVLAALAIVVVATTPASVHWDVVWVGNDFSASALIGPIAMVLFAHVGTGSSNIAAYSAMSSGDFRRAAVRRALTVVTIALVAWLVPMTLLFGHAGLAQLHTDKTNTAMGLTTLAPAGSISAIMLALLGSFVTLIAVTNANAGFITSLAREIKGATSELRPSVRRLPSEHTLTLILVGALSAAAGGAVAAGDSLATMVYIAGFTGGGVIIFIAPLLAEQGDRAARIRWSVVAILIAIACGAGVSDLAFTSGLGTGAAIVMTTVGWLPFVPTVFSARGVIHAGNAGGPPEAEPYDIYVTVGSVGAHAAPPVPVTAMSAAPREASSRA